MERRAVPGELSGRRGVATLVRSFPRSRLSPQAFRRNLEICNNIADNLSKAGWSWGYVSAINSNGRTIWIADAHRDDGKRFVASFVLDNSPPPELFKDLGLQVT
jgi:hypothetical protein